jgi:hypothetical protein
MPSRRQDLLFAENDVLGNTLPRAKNYRHFNARREKLA